MENKIQLSLLLLSIAFFSCKGIEKQSATIEKHENIMSDTTNIKKIYSKKINNYFELELNRKADKTYCAWEINLVGKKEKRVIKTDSLTKDEIESTHFRLMHHPMFYDAFQILDAIHDKSTNRLFVLIDRYGEIVLYQYGFDGKRLSSISQQNKIQVTTYLIRRQDVILILAGNAKLNILNNDLLIGVSIMKNKYYRVNLNTRKTTTLLFDYYNPKRVKIKDEESHEFISKGDLSRKNETKKIIEKLLEKKGASDQSWIYHFFIETPDSVYSFEKDGKRNGLVYFFTTVNGNKKVLIYDTSAAKEWVITDYQELSEGESEDNTWK